MQIHYHGNTIPNRHPERVTEQNGVEVYDPCTKRLFFGKAGVAGKV